jgi:D-lyxose ketol-isomerase
MKRSRINEIMKSADAFMRSCGFILPPFAYWTPQDWQKKGTEVAEIVNNGLGWDITDFGSGDFDRTGLFLFTLRNGHFTRPELKPYAEKIMIAEDGQVTPLHFHWNKTEDIINRGGGILAIELFQATQDEALDRKAKVNVSIDGVRRQFDPGALIELKPGESITLTPRLYHRFWGKNGRVLIGEVSAVNDDHNDNRFLDAPGRFPSIEEDVPPLHLLVGDYEKYYRAS